MIRCEEHTSYTDKLIGFHLGQPDRSTVHSIKMWWIIWTKALRMNDTCKFDFMLQVMLTADKAWSAPFAIIISISL